MKRMKLWTIALMSVMLAACTGALSKEEQSVITEGRLMNEAVANEFRDYFYNYWEERVLPTINDSILAFSREANQTIESANLFFGSGMAYLAQAGAHKQMEKLQYIGNAFQESYEQTMLVLIESLVERGLDQTVEELNGIMEAVKAGDQEWMFSEDEHALGCQLGLAIADPRYGFRPAEECLACDYRNAATMPWTYIFGIDLRNGGNGKNCMYNALGLMLDWMKEKQTSPLSVLYCTGIEQSPNSYLVGYSNHYAYMVTFYRNNDTGSLFEFQETEYDATNVGNSVL